MELYQSYPRDSKDNNVQKRQRIVCCRKIEEELRCDMYFVDLYCVWKKGRRKISTGFCGSSILKAEIYPEQAKLRKKKFGVD